MFLAAIQSPSDNQAAAQAKWMQLFIPFMSGLLLGWWAHFLSTKRESRNRVKKAKDDFGVFIREQVAALPQRGVREFYDRTKPSIRDAVHRVWHFIESDDQRRRLDILWREYDEIPAHEFNRAHEGAMGEVMRALSKIAQPPVEFQTPYEIVKYYLDEFYKFSA